MLLKSPQMLAAFFFAMLFITSCQSKEARGLKALTGTRSRVVWVQDQGEAKDPFCRNVDLKLMGFASALIVLCSFGQSGCAHFVSEAGTTQ